MVTLGEQVQDTVTGFKGTALAYTQHITGCRRIQVQPKVDKEGKLPDPEWFDEALLIVTKKAVNPQSVLLGGG